ncbi:MAG: RNA polymerase sporulation sigma factor SigH [Solirubrobacterales bacterium]|nr:RNA polymerase sporulation sigma factor SigH [Solirubrobacterales bacterium]
MVARAKAGDLRASDHLIRRYQKFVRLKASSYFLVGGDSEDLVQEGLLGLHKAIRDYRSDRESSFRSFAELCITRQIITAVKSATRNKHAPLNQYVSFGQSPAASGDSDTTMEEILPGPSCFDPANQAISSEELACLVSSLKGSLSEMESAVLGHYLEDRSYEEVAGLLECDTKTVDNALQRVKRKVIRHLESRQVAA